MTEDEQSMGQRRRRREDERAAREASEQRPLTRRELRARETALQTGAIEIDATGAVRVIKDEAAAEPASAGTPADPAGAPQSELTDTAGFSRRQLRELQARHEAAAASSAAEPTPARGIPAPTPPVRRPVVRPPATTGAMRSLAEDGTGLTPVVRDEPHQPKDDPTSTGALTAIDPSESVDVTDVTMRAVKETVAAAEPQVDAARTVADAGPLPTTRRSRRLAAERVVVDERSVAEAEVPAAVPGSAPSLDELIAGESEVREPFDARPSWVELPPLTPVAPLAVLQPERPEAETEVGEAVPAAAVTPRTDAADDPAADDDDDDDATDEDEHRTPVWLSALMVLVLVVIGVVLGLLVWRMVSGDGAAGADAVRDVTSAMALKGWMT